MWLVVYDQQSIYSGLICFSVTLASRRKSVVPKAWNGWCSGTPELINESRTDEE